jgi:hypothetical protein
MTTMHISEAVPLEAPLGVIPSLPRPLLSRLTERVIERMDELEGDADLEDCEGQARVDDRGRYLFDRKQRGRGRRKGRLNVGITEDDEEGGDRELEGSEEDLTGCVRYSLQRHPDMDRVKRELKERWNNAAQRGFS